MASRPPPQPIRGSQPLLVPPGPWPPFRPQDSPPGANQRSVNTWRGDGVGSYGSGARGLTGTQRKGHCQQPGREGGAPLPAPSMLLWGRGSWWARASSMDQTRLKHILVTILTSSTAVKAQPHPRAGGRSATSKVSPPFLSCPRRPGPRRTQRTTQDHGSDLGHLLRTPPARPLTGRAEGTAEASTAGAAGQREMVIAWPRGPPGRAGPLTLWSLFRSQWVQGMSDPCPLSPHPRL